MMMMMENVSAVTMFTLSGFNYTLEQRAALFFFTLLWYLMILWGNVTLIVAVVMDRTLHQPMYIFVCNLCISSLVGTVGFYPKFLLDLLTLHVISYAGCMLQGYIIHMSTCSDFFILAVMAYDRYLAICRPLVYHSVMTKQRVSILVFLSWFIPFYSMFMNSATLLGVTLCGSHIERVYCINYMIISLACSKPVANAVVSYINILFYFGQFLFVVWSYAYLIRMCMSSKDKWGKFMQTCLPHLISLIVFVITVLLDLLYVRFGSLSYSKDLNNFMAIEFLLIPPVINPLIYGLNLTKVRRRIFKN